MPTKFVQNTAARMGTSVEHAEKVWADAKHAVKKGKRQGSWYWGKVVNTFKRMMGINEAMTFADYTCLLEDELSEAEKVTIPKLLKTMPKTIMVGKGGYFLKMTSSTSVKVLFRVGRLMGEDAAMFVVVVLRTSVGRGRIFTVQAHGPATERLGYEQRTRFVETDSGINPLSTEFLKQFMLDVLTDAGMLQEDKKEGGIKKSYLNFKGSSKKKKLKDEMKREIKRYSKMDHKDKDAYPDDWTADQKYKAELKKKGKKLPKSRHTTEYERRYGK